MLLFGVLQTFMQYGLFFLGLNLVPGAISAIIIGGGPLFVALMAHFTISDEPLTKRKSLAIGLGMTGIIFTSLSKGGVSSVDATLYLGIGLLILSNIIGASTNIIVAKNRNRVSPTMLTAFANFTGGVILYIISFFTEEWQIKSYTTEFYIALLWLAFIPAAGFTIWFGLLKNPQIKVSDLNIWKFITPVTGVVLSWLLLPDEVPDVYSVIGVLIIAFSLITLQWQPGSSKKS